MTVVGVGVGVGVDIVTVTSQSSEVKVLDRGGQKENREIKLASENVVSPESNSF